MTDFARRAVPPAIVLLTFAAAVVATVLANRPVMFPLDDAYITIGNAEALLRGGVDNYGADRPTAATSLVHLLLLTGLAAVFATPTANLILSIAAAALYGAGLYRLLEASGVGRLVSTVGTLLGLFAGAAWAQLMNGLETALALAAATWALWLVTDPFPPRLRRTTGLLLGALPFIRPELAVLSLCLYALALHRDRRNLGQACILTAGMALSALALAASAWITTGEIIPGTAGAKIAYFAESPFALTRKLRVVAQIVAECPIVLILLGQLFLLPRPVGWAVNGFAAAVLLVAAHRFPGGLLHNDFRYLYIFLPFGLYGWALLGARADLAGRLVRGGFLAASVLVAATVLTQSWPDYRRALRVTADQEELAAWALRNLPADARVLVHDAGYFAWRTEIALIDVVGLKTPSSVEIHKRITLPSGGAERGAAVAEIAGLGQPSHAIILDVPFWRDIRAHLEQAGWQLVELRPEATGAYRLYRLAPPGAVQDG